MFCWPLRCHAYFMSMSFIKMSYRVQYYIKYSFFNLFLIQINGRININQGKIKIFESFTG